MTVDHPIRSKRLPDGTEFFVKEIEFDVITEPWARYSLKDGGEVRHRLLALRMFEVHDKNADGTFTLKMQADGDKMVFVETSNQTVHST